MKKLQILIAIILCTATLGLSTIAPAKADGAASTRNIILGAAAIAAGAFIANNVASKNAAANTVAGYTGNGATVYNDGHVVMPNGQSYYPNNEGQSVSCDGGGNCSVTGGGYRTGYGYRR